MEHIVHSSVFSPFSAAQTFRAALRAAAAKSWAEHDVAA
jgi:hypothetical protein